MAYSTIDKSSLHFNPIIYTGNGGTQALTGVGFQPDWVWVKSRDVAKDHMVFDVVRGVQKSIRPNATTAEDNSSEYLTTFGTDGFTLGGNGKTNGNGNTFVAWNWKAGNSQGSSNTAGSINTTYTSVNTTAGFSISTYTGTAATATIGHGLGVVPKMIITKRISGGNEDWGVYHASVGATKYLKLNADASLEEKQDYAREIALILVDKYQDTDIEELTTFNLERNKFELVSETKQITNSVKIYQEYTSNPRGFIEKSDNPEAAMEIIKGIESKAKLNGYVDEKGNGDVFAFYNRFIEIVENRNPE